MMWIAEFSRIPFFSGMSLISSTGSRTGSAANEKQLWRPMTLGRWIANSRTSAKSGGTFESGSKKFAKKSAPFTA
jgi:hypothetical protein